jgi:endonuclease/exonuclease/phosphatase family metal-dependent hydrolase
MITWKDGLNTMNGSRIWFMMVIIVLNSSFLMLHSTAQRLTFVEYNVENIFDTRHDEGKQDQEFLPDATRQWTEKRYWKKLDRIGKSILSTSEDGIPDLIALCEVENDQTLIDLTKRSLLKNAGYEYVMTQSPDARGVDVALMYSPFSFGLIRSYGLRIDTIPGMKPTRDILYACGELQSGDTLHVFVVHAPSRNGGEKVSRPFRLQAANRLLKSVDSIRVISPDARILICGDFNDYHDSPAVLKIDSHDLKNISKAAHGKYGVKGTYRYKGEWNSLDHILVSPAVYAKVDTVFIHSPKFLLEEDKLFGGYMPRRTYKGMKFQKKGFSDHLPLVARFRW